MRTRLILGSCLLSLAVVAAQQPSRDAAVQTVTGTGMIAGRLMTDASAAQPVRRARVTLNGADRAVARTATTDDAGGFVFRDLPAGRFSVQATKPGYLTTNFGAPRPERPGTSITLGDGQQVINITMTLTRGGVITGRVLDQSGQPAPGVSISVLRFGFSELTGERSVGTPSVGARTLTDDRGIYRAYGLPPGEYLVMASLTFGGGAGRGAPGLEDLRQLSPPEIQRALELAQTGRVGGAAVSTPLARGRGSERRVNYAPVFYPDATDVARASTISLGAGEERSGVDIQILLVPTARIEGVAVVPEGVRPDTVTVTVAPSGSQAGLLAGAGAPRTLSTRLDRDGKFQFAGIAPGSYTVTAKTAPSGGQPPPADSTARSLWGMAEITVDGSDVATTLELQPGMIVSGRLVFDGSSPPPKNLAAMRIFLIPPGAGANMSAGPPGGQVDADGKFTFSGVTPGIYRFVYLSGGASSWVLRSSIANGRDAYDVPLTIKPGENVEWILKFTDRPAELTGVLQDATGRPAPDYFIIVFPTDRSFWTPASRRVRTTRPATDGKYVTAGLPPGDYFIAALIDVEQGEWNDPKFLEQLVPSAVKVTLAESQKKTQDLRIVK